MAFKVGDKVRCKESFRSKYTGAEVKHGNQYTVSHVYDNGNIVLEGVVYTKPGYAHDDSNPPCWGRNMFERVDSDLLVKEFKVALENLREAGYDVKVTLTKTVVETEEL